MPRSLIRGQNFLFVQSSALRPTAFMNPWRLIAILEKCDPSFQELFYPDGLRCPLEKRIVRAIEEDWPAYFPTRKECRGSNWALDIPENKPLYKPHPKSIQKLNQWKEKIVGTIVEGRASGADVSWRRFLIICRKSPGLRPFLKDFKPLANFLIHEESMWPRYGGRLVDMDNFIQNKMAAILAPDSPYHHSDPQRLRLLKFRKRAIEKIQIIDQMRGLFDRPLMALAVLQKCADESKQLMFWLNLRNHINAILKTPASISFRKIWLEHAMQASGATKKTGNSCPRKWAGMLLTDKNPHWLEINIKAIEVNSWLKGKKCPSVKNIQRSWQVIIAPRHLSPWRDKSGYGGWIFSWMITLWMEKHFEEIAAAFKCDVRKIRNYYRRFFHYLEIDLQNGKGKKADR